MMGRSHAIAGAVSWVAFAAVAPEITGLVGGMGAAGIAAGSLIAAGMALWPDLDQKSSTASRALPPVTSVLSALLALISGGHRKGTHSLLGLAVTLFGAYALSWWTVTIGDVEFGPGPALAAIVVAGLAFDGLELGLPQVVTWLLSLATGGVVWMLLPHARVEPWTFARPSWFVLAVGVGYLAHLVGDMLTARGVPLLWPFSWRARIPVIGHTGDRSLSEHLVLGVWIGFATAMAAVGFTASVGAVA